LAKARILGYLCSVSSILTHIHHARAIGKPLLAILIDPGKLSNHKVMQLLERAKDASPDLFLVGGSTSSAAQVPECVELIRSSGIKCPIVLFPGHETQVHSSADGLLLLSLISGRNADLLIGKHVSAAQDIHRSGLEVLPTGYILVESGKLTSVAYISQTQPVPRDNTDVAVSTALAGQLLGLKLIYLEAGSGARWPVPPEIIHAVKGSIQIPLVVGGGIDSVEKLSLAIYAGADMVVVGNALESDPDLLTDLVLNMRALSVREDN
jgi:phosphoglycerol geranylgeranyltransferase